MLHYRAKKKHVLYKAPHKCVYISGSRECFICGQSRVDLAFKAKRKKLK